MRTVETYKDSGNKETIVKVMENEVEIYQIHITEQGIVVIDTRTDTELLEAWE
jgi:hypothetical protein